MTLMISLSLPWWLRGRVGVVRQCPLGSMKCSLENQGAAFSLLLHNPGSQIRPQSRLLCSEACTHVPLPDVGALPCTTWDTTSHLLIEDNAPWWMLFLFHKPVVITENKSTLLNLKFPPKAKGGRRGC